MDRARAFEVQKVFFAQKNPSVIVDVGANVGDMTDKYVSMFPGSQVYCFEPVPGTFERLDARFSAKPHVRCLRLAVGDGGQNVRVYETSSSANSSLSRPDRYIADSGNDGMSASVSVVDTHTVRQATLDSFCSDNGIANVDILRMDIQGSELAALRGASRLLGDQRIGVIYSEVLFAGLYEGQCHFHEVAGFLHGKGYGLFDLPFLARSGDGRLYCGDAVFLNRDLMGRHRTLV